MPVVTLGTVTATTAELSWNGLSEGYTVMYRESIVRVAGEWQTLSVDEAAVTLNNLVPEADYEVKVVPDCDPTKESTILTFTTANPCEAPTNLAVGNITTTTAEISWEGFSLTGYEVECAIPSGEPMTLTVEEGTTATLTGLAANTTYEVRVKANCYEAEYCLPVVFTTDLCLPEDKCTLTFVVTDSRGYGWNGNAIQVKDALTGDIIATIANQNLDGAYGEETQTIVLNVCDGRELEFSWVGKYFVYNVSYIVTDINGETHSGSTVVYVSSRNLLLSCAYLRLFSDNCIP